MKVAYYTSTFFMDVMLEIIQGIKKRVELYVFIEISQNSKNATLLNIETIENFKFIEDAEVVLGREKWEKFKPYFKDVKSVQFVVYKNRRSFSMNTFYKSYLLGKYLKKLDIQIFHFDNISQRSIGLYPFLRTIKVCISIHDPKAHTGEENWRDVIVNKLYYRITSFFIFYSIYSKNQFIKLHGQFNKPTICISLLPYTFIRNYLINLKEETILFFGRLSFYKGIDILIEAIPKVLEKFPDQKFVIAGSNQYGYVLKYFKDNRINFIEKYITLEEIADQLSISKFVVCPYREATQSGVLMTAFAAEKTVIASDVGSFNEYIQNGVNGWLIPPNAGSLSNAIINALDGSKYKTIKPQFSDSVHKKRINEIGDQLFKMYMSFVY